MKKKLAILLIVCLACAMCSCSCAPQKLEIRLNVDTIAKDVAVGEKYNFDAIEFEVFANGEKVSQSASVTFDGLDTSVVGRQRVTVTARYKWAKRIVTFEVFVYGKAQRIITVHAVPRTVRIGEPLDLSGAYVSVEFAGGYTKNVYKNISFSEFDSSVLGAQNLVVYYGGVSTNYTITVVEQ